MIIGLRLRDRFASKLFLSRNTKGKRSYMNTSLYVRLVLMALGLFAISLVQAWDYTGTNVGNINGYSTNFYPSGSGNGFPSYSFESNIPTFTSNYPTGYPVYPTYNPYGTGYPSYNYGTGYPMGYPTGYPMGYSNSGYPPY